jgi:hypothetical protein
VQASNYIDPNLSLPGMEAKLDGFAKFRVVP